MTHRHRVNEDALLTYLSGRGNVASHQELERLGLARSTVSYRIRPSGPWNGILPGVVINHKGTPTGEELARVALTYAGEGAILTGVSALRRYRFQFSVAGEHALVPHRRQRSSRDFVIVERTTRIPQVTLVRGLPCAPVARALFDACRRLRRLDQVRELVAHVLQRGGCSLAEFVAEVRAGARGRSALSRLVLREMSAGVRSVAEARARQVMLRAGLPAAEWNADLLTAAGEWLGRVDAVWLELAAVIEIDSMAWHLSPARYKQTQRRQRRLTTRGILVLPTAPGDIVDNPDGFVADVRALLAEAARRDAPNLLIKRAA